MACQRAASSRCSCSCRGRNHGLVDPRLAALIEARRALDGQPMFGARGGPPHRFQDYVDGVNDALRISAEREGRPLPGRLL